MKYHEIIELAFEVLCEELQLNKDHHVVISCFRKVFARITGCHYWDVGNYYLPAKKKLDFNKFKEVINEKTNQSAITKAIETIHNRRIELLRMPITISGHSGNYIIRMSKGSIETA